VVIPPGGSLVLTGSCCAQTGDIFVCLLEIDNKSLTGGAGCDINNSVSGNCLGSNGPNANGTVPTTVSPPCNVPNNWSMTWSAQSVQIH
jgi:hypothetical protein